MVQLRHCLRLLVVVSAGWKEDQEGTESLCEEGEEAKKEKAIYIYYTLEPKAL